MKYKLVLFITFLFHTLYAQNVEFKATVSKNHLGANERLRIEFSMNKDGDNFVAPNFQGFTVVMGPSQSISRSWINGVSSFSKTYIYILQPNSKGNFTIQPASIEIDGRTYKTNPIQITVSAAVNNPSIDRTSRDIANDNIFLLAEVSKANPYLSEAVSVTYRLYVGGEVALSELRGVNVPKYANFWSQDINFPEYKIENCTYQGRQYRCIVVKKVVLYPQKVGNITLDPFTLEATLNVPTSQRDFFGRPMYEQVRRRITSGGKTLEVRNLPEEGKPENFSGAVGEFSFDVNASKHTLKAGESLQLKVQVLGSGNLKLFEMPKPTFPSSLEVYSPEQKEDINTSLAGMRGHVEQAYTIVPQYKGKYPISGLSFSYFNPNTGKYVTLKTDDIWIDVTDGPISENKRMDNEQGNLSEKQFKGVQSYANLQPKNKTLFFGSVPYYLCLLLPLCIIPIVLLLWYVKQKREGDIQGTKARLANRLAKKYLSEAKQKLNDKSTFYEALERALHNYLKAKLKIETSEMSKEKITDLLLEKHAEASTVNSFIQLLSNCEIHRYSQQHTEASLTKDFQEAIRVISDLDKQVKK